MIVGKKNLHCAKSPISSAARSDRTPRPYRTGAASHSRREPHLPSGPPRRPHGGPGQPANPRTRNTLIMLWSREQRRICKSMTDIRQYKISLLDMNHIYQHKLNLSECIDGLHQVDTRRPQHAPAFFLAVSLVEFIILTVRPLTDTNNHNSNLAILANIGGDASDVITMKSWQRNGAHRFIRGQGDNACFPGRQHGLAQ